MKQNFRFCKLNCQPYLDCYCTEGFLLSGKGLKQYEPAICS